MLRWVPRAEPAVCVHEWVQISACGRFRSRVGQWVENGRVRMRMTSDEKGKSGTVLSFESADAPDKIVAFYRAAAAKAGYQIGSEMKTGEMEMLTGKNAAEDGFTLTASREGDKTNISLIGGVRD